MVISRAPRQELISARSAASSEGSELGLEHVEARRERELRAAVTRSAAIQMRLGRLRALVRISTASRTWPARLTVSAPPAAGVDRVSKRTVRTDLAGIRRDARPACPRHADDHRARPRRCTWFFASVTLAPSTVAVPGDVFETGRQHDHRAAYCPQLTPSRGRRPGAPRVRHRRRPAAATS